jgi:hypothetical protein
MNVPDYISPVVGFRVWQWDATGLRSLNGEKWVAHQPLSAVCRADACGSISGLSKATHNPDELPCFKCTCGVYAARTMEHLNQCGYQKFGVHGEVYLWGKVVEHERGWRAQFAYPKRLFLSPDILPFTLAGIQSRLKTLTAYRIDVFVADPNGNIPLSAQDSDFNLAGVDYLINMSNEYYSRRRQERTLKKGDRVAVLGRGIAVVEQVDHREVHVLLRNTHALRVSPNHVTWDQQNMRWECELVSEKA